MASAGAAGVDGGGSGGEVSGQAGSAGEAAGTAGSAGASATLPVNVTVHLVPQEGVAGVQRVNFAVPLAPGQLDDESLVRVLDAGEEIAAYRRALARHADGSLRSVQIQFDLDDQRRSGRRVCARRSADHAGALGDAVESTLVDRERRARSARLGACLPAAWLSGSGFAGPLVPGVRRRGQRPPRRGPRSATTSAGAPMRSSPPATRATARSGSSIAGPRCTAATRGAAISAPLRSAYIETSMYRNRITGTGTGTRNGVPPGGADDVKYAYAQNLALHYLLTGDDRLPRERRGHGARHVAAVDAIPGYAGGADFWTERHAGFGLLAYVWAMIVSDDQSADFRRARRRRRSTPTSRCRRPTRRATPTPTARCFAHTGDAHGEGGAYFGCSPWMSAILADALDAVRARERRDARRARPAPRWSSSAASSPARHPARRPALLLHGRRHRREHARGVRRALRRERLPDRDGLVLLRQDRRRRCATAADALVAGSAATASVPHVRSFNWQCRSAVAASWYLQ